MQILYASHQVWRKPVVEDPISVLGKNNQARLRATLRRVSKTTIDYSIEPLTPKFVEWFVPLYTETISEKTHPKLSDIYGNTLGKDVSYQYFILRLFEDGVPIGATIFSERKEMLAVSYRVYPTEWGTVRLRANPSLYSEYLLNRYAFSRGYRLLSQGRDRNPYGPNAQIGLAIFKLSIGCAPYIPEGAFEIGVLDPGSVDVDTLVFEMPAEGSKIAKGYLICATDECETKYVQVTHYSEQVSVQIISPESLSS